ncbi:hypothetical protein [Planktothrix serta]|nr:hypothetical protein [Planktothrix serta]
MFFRKLIQKVNGLIKNHFLRRYPESSHPYIVINQFYPDFG